MGRMKAMLISREPTDQEIAEMLEEMLLHMPIACFGVDYTLEDLSDGKGASSKSDLDPTTRRSSD